MSGGRWAIWGLVTGVLLAPSLAAASCPCYAPGSAFNNYNCAVAPAPGNNLTVSEWLPIFGLVSQGPSAWGSQGPQPSIGMIGDGPGSCVSPPTGSVQTRFPCELLYGIAMQESGWRQFCASTSPSDEVSATQRTIISFDCGYGIAQVTSGMSGPAPTNYDRTRVPGEPTYNLATGAQILAGKWQAAGCVGNNHSSIIEDWYTATWGYNGFTYGNNPSNPTFSASRGVWNPQVGGAAPYQEIVWGQIENPPAGFWTSVALAYPNPGTVGNGLSNIPEPTCASPTNCTQTRSVHTSACNSSTGPDAGTDAGTATDAGPPPDAGTPISFVLSGLPASAPSGTSLTFTVLAHDGAGAVATGYNGTAVITSSDPSALLPPPLTFTAGVCGNKSVTFLLAGPQTLTATDRADPTRTVTGSVNVVPGPVNTYKISGLPAAAAAGATTRFSVTAVDASGNVATDYAGNAAVTTSDTAAVLPANPVFVQGIAANVAVTFATPGLQTVTVTDTTVSRVTATSPVTVIRTIDLPGFPRSIGPTSHGPSCGCGVTSGSASCWFALASLGLVLARRRRR